MEEGVAPFSVHTPPRSLSVCLQSTFLTEVFAAMDPVPRVNRVADPAMQSGWADFGGGIHGPRVGVLVVR